MKKLLVLFCVSLLSYSSIAQTAKISGHVKDAHEDKPVNNAVVALFTPKDSILYSFTRTDSSGNYLLKDVQRGPYILMVSQPRYADVLTDIQVNNDTKVPGTALLSKSRIAKRSNR